MGKQSIRFCKGKPSFTVYLALPIFSWLRARPWAQHHGHGNVCQDTTPQNTEINAYSAFNKKGWYMNSGSCKLHALLTHVIVCCPHQPYFIYLPVAILIKESVFIRCSDENLTDSHNAELDTCVSSTSRPPSCHQTVWGSPWWCWPLAGCGGWPQRGSKWCRVSFHIHVIGM